MHAHRAARSILPHANALRGSRRHRPPIPELIQAVGLENDPQASKFGFVHVPASNKCTDSTNVGPLQTMEPSFANTYVNAADCTEELHDG